MQQCACLYEGYLLVNNTVDLFNEVKEDLRVDKSTVNHTNHTKSDVTDCPTYKHAHLRKMLHMRQLNHNTPGGVPETWLLPCCYP